MKSPGEKAAAFLSSLQGAGASSVSAAEGAATAAVAAQALGPLQQRLEEMARRLEEVAKVVEPPAEGEPPKAPTELMLFLQTRTELLEQRLREAQAEALRAGLLLREREEAQRKAQKEVEELFRSIREQSRAASWDSALREKFSAAQSRIAELEARLLDLERGSVPAEEALRLFTEEAGREELLGRLREKAARAALPAPPPGAPAPPPPALRGPSAAAAAADPRILQALMGRLSDLERQLERAGQERDQERARRLLWEKDIFGAVRKLGEKWQRTGGAKVVVEAALQGLVGTLQARDALTAEMSRLMDRIRQEPPDSDGLAELRARLAKAQDELEGLEEALDKHMALVRAWLQEGRTGQGE